MKIFVKVRPGAKTEKVEKISENTFSVLVKAPAKDGRANEALMRVLSDYFKTAPTSIKILRGHNSRNKVLEIL